MEDANDTRRDGSVARSATVTQCVVLLEGWGARQGSLTEGARAPLLSCGDRPFLAWLLREFVRFGVTDFLLLCEPPSTRIEAAVDTIAAYLPRAARITIAPTPVGAGTGGAVFHARARLDDRFVLCHGDRFFDFNLADLLSSAAGDEDGVVGRIALRPRRELPSLSDVAMDGDTTSGTVSSGVGLFRRSVIDRIAPRCSMEIEVMPRLAAARVLRGTRSCGYFCDFNVPEDSARAQEDLPRLLHRRALFLDRDGVLNVDRGHVGTRERFEWIPGARDALRYATQKGWHVFVVTNQSGIARGYYDEAAVRGLLDWAADEARRSGGTIDDVRYCPFHEDAVVEAYRRPSDWRKPAPGMVLDLIRAWELDPKNCLMVGDQLTDVASAAAAGVQGHLFGGGNLLTFVRGLLG